MLQFKLDTLCSSEIHDQAKIIGMSKNISVSASTETMKLAVAIHLEEYKAMRAEILEHLKFEAMAITFGTSVLAVASGTLATLYTHGSDYQSLILFLIAGLPVLAFLFAMWMVHKEAMASEIALYLISELRLRLTDLTGEKHILGWEGFRTARAYSNNIEKPPKILSIFGHAFFALFMALSTWLSWYLITPELDQSFGIAIRLLLCLDVVLLGSFIVCSIRVANLHKGILLASSLLSEI